MAKHEGVEVTIGGEKFVLPKLSIKNLRKLAEAGHMKVLNQPPAEVFTSEWLDAAVSAIHLALQRNHQSIERDFIEDNVELPDLLPLLALAMNGFKKAEAASPNVESP